MCACSEKHCKAIMPRLMWRCGFTLRGNKKDPESLCICRRARWKRQETKERGCGWITTSTSASSRFLTILVFVTYPTTGLWNSLMHRIPKTLYCCYSDFRVHDHVCVCIKWKTVKKKKKGCFSCVWKNQFVSQMLEINHHIVSIHVERGFGGVWWYTTKAKFPHSMTNTCLSLLHYRSLLWMSPFISELVTASRCKGPLATASDC